ncbi:TPA: hypothetical protein N0F65_002688 [Lagenidium giganteum]|uniref:Uncharacterized protein n=1 Tax=Lagenidium giganteum TaxID=4803 RepID=A0AAV2Z155_9STRA|nr:TPA: hypothetical protein N0F65_002688 [Lagenidium giganteum]
MQARIQAGTTLPSAPDRRRQIPVIGVQVWENIQTGTIVRGFVPAGLLPIGPRDERGCFYVARPREDTLRLTVRSPDTNRSQQRPPSTFGQQCKALCWTPPRDVILISRGGLGHLRGFACRSLGRRHLCH